MSANVAYGEVKLARGGHCIGDCTPTRDRGQSEVKRSSEILGVVKQSRWEWGAGQRLSRRSMGVVNAG